MEYEALLEIRRQTQATVFKEYVKENCDEKGRQKSNLTKQQTAGLKKLKKRVADGEIIVCQTDKSGRLCVMPMELYIEAGDTHVSKDMVVDDKFVRGTQKKLNGHVAMWIKCLNMGENWEHTDRLRQTQINHSCLVPPLYLLIKDHKRYSCSGPPPARPVCGAVNGMDVHLSNILSHIIESVADEMKHKTETEGFGNLIIAKWLCCRVFQWLVEQIGCLSYYSHSHPFSPFSIFCSEGFGNI